MKATVFTKGIFIVLLVCGLHFYNPANAQVGIGTTTPNPNALLDIDATTTAGGLLLPRVALTSTTGFAPLTSHVQGMTVYNTATTGDVTPGYYYNDGAAWERIAVENNWGRSGNAGTTAGTNFIGTTDNVSLRIKSNTLDRFEITSGTTLANGGRMWAFADGGAGSPIYSWNTDTNLGIYRISADILGFSTSGTEKMRIEDDGQISVNGTPLFAGDRFTVRGTANEYAVNGYSSGSGGAGVYGENNSNGIGVWGNVGSGFGVFGTAQNTSAFGVVARNLSAGGTGLLAAGDNILPANLSGGLSISGIGDEIGIFGYGIDIPSGTGIVGAGNAGSIYTLTEGSGIAGTGNEIGAFGMATGAGEAYGGYFATPFGDYAFVGGWDGATQIKISGTGSMGTIVKDVDNNIVKMFATESPEILFQDYGIGTLENGTATILLDPILSKNIRVDTDHPLKVFIQLEGDCKGVYVTDKSVLGFTVKELQGGISNVPFSWSIVATRADEEIITQNGVVRISNNSVRFPPAPGPMEVVTHKTQEGRHGNIDVQIEDKTSENLSSSEN